MNDTLERAAEIWAHVQMECLEEDRLYYEWARGPGREYPKQTVMMRRITGAPLAPVEVWADGWMDAFEKYKQANWQIAPLRSDK